MKSYMRYSPSPFAFMIIFVSDEIGAKMPQRLNYESKKIQFLGENGRNTVVILFQTKAQKSSYLNFIWEIW